MSREIRWQKSINTRIGVVAVVLLAFVMALVVANYYILWALNADARRMELVGRGRTLCYKTMYLTQRYAYGSSEDQPTTRAELDETLAAMTERYRKLQKGDAAEGIPATTNREVLRLQDENSKGWNENISPMAKELTAASTPEAARAELAPLQAKLQTFYENVERRIGEEQNAAQARLRYNQWLQVGLGAVTLLAVGLVLWISRGVSTRIRSLASAADRIAGGELTQVAHVGHEEDEISSLATAFNSMTGNLNAKLQSEQASRAQIESLLEGVRGAVAQLSSAAAEILASTTQQAAGAQQQAAAVSQTTATVNEITHTSSQAAERAKEVSDSARRADEIGKAGRKAVEETIQAMQSVRQQVEAIAENILTLAERAQAISEIIATVNEIADRTNLLALNAAIEASRAGEQGKGFAVVAGEVKALAEQSKKATNQVRQILGEIQQATNKAVVSTEQGTKAVASATSVVAKADGTIETLSETITASARSAAQIVASAGQQASGMSQVNEAMASIDQATRQTLASTRQAEQAARDINELGVRLARLIEGDARAHG